MAEERDASPTEGALLISYAAAASGVGRLLFGRMADSKLPATLEINPNGLNLRPDHLDWIVRYQIGFFHSSSQCEQVVGP